MDRLSLRVRFKGSPDAVVSLLFTWLALRDF